MRKILLFLLFIFPFESHARDMTQRKYFLEQMGFIDPYHVPKGYEVDHIVPLCLGGADIQKNMQLLTIENHKKKTKKDRKDCRNMKKDK